ncbi:phospholipase D-like domain-containing protein [Hymenobacter sp. BT770]|uniref:phospholipase D-like domain-containing protein n=1 Tax=Hymenobacter sp. BT770 TaxID=2886942 RepID=UPI001D0F7E79|nr:phospholipase D-like domain-containing protein [Hymenobacter sp. BT770]MCC3152111.1 phospholipase D-like domain-containing protein [Hymenobacter sp. BT770]MDO3415206.1 phospholipase D-like domain-containing protein [Hymenobacter sp. BT770]
MKKFTLLALLACATSWHAVKAQTPITIAAARAQAPATNTTAGPTVTVTGIVTNGNELGSTVSTIRYIQDGTAGIGVYTSTSGTTGALIGSLVPGDSILVTGGLKMFRGLLEIDPISSVTVLAGNRKVPAPVVFTAANFSAAYAEKYEGQLVRLNGLTSVNTTGGALVTAFTANTTYRLNNNSTLVTYVNANSTGPNGLVGKPSPTGTFDAVGVLSQYASTSAGTTDGYQLLNRTYADFIQGNTPNLTSNPVPSNITTTGFTVSFNTQNSGDTQVLYSTSPTLSPATTVTAAGQQGTQHSVAISGLLPATVYYVQAVSVNATGRSESRVTPMITASLSSGRMKTYFTNTVDNTLALPNNNAVYLPSGHVADTLAAYIDRAQQTLDITIYNWNSPVILTAVNAAYARGVQVRVIYEDDNSNFSIAQLTPAIPRIFRPAQAGSTGSAIMHNKFVVIDANSTNVNRPMVWTGSTNWTPAQLSTDRNNVVTIQDQSLARVYTMEFEEMWGSSTTTPGTALFGSRKTDNTPHYLVIGGKKVESWFSPTDNVNARLIETIRTADYDLHVLSMLVTRTDIGRAIADQVTLRNIAQCSDGLTNDTSGVAGFVFRTIRGGGLGNRYLYDHLTGIMHHKTLIVDAGASQSDPTVFVGSHNWTASADTENDENTLVIHDARITNQYYQEYAARIANQNQGITACRLVLATRAGTVQASTMQAYPNPTRGSFNLHLASTTARTASIVLRDVTGRVVLERTQSYTGADLTIDATSLKSGLYMVQVMTPESVQTSRVVVE